MSTITWQILTDFDNFRTKLTKNAGYFN